MKKRILNKKTQLYLQMALMVAVGMMALVSPDAFWATEAAKQQVLGKMTNFFDLFVDIVSILGQVYTLWGIAEWGLAWHESNGTMGGQSFKRIFGGLFVVLAPQILVVIA